MCGGESRCCSGDVNVRYGVCKSLEAVMRVCPAECGAAPHSAVLFMSLLQIDAKASSKPEEEEVCMRRCTAALI
jgi:hypothetical protein